MMPQDLPVDPGNRMHNAVLRALIANMENKQSQGYFAPPVSEDYISNELSKHVPSLFSNTEEQQSRAREAALASYTQQKLGIGSDVYSHIAQGGNLLSSILNPIDPSTGLPNVSLGVVPPAVKMARKIQIANEGREATTPLTGFAKDVAERIMERNTFYHATDPESAVKILESGAISPSLGDLDAGVSVSRVPRISPKADKAISFELDAAKTPPSRPFTEPGYRKTLALPMSSETIQWYKENAPSNLEDILKNNKPNKRFEFENRTFNEPISTDAIKRVLVDRSALKPGNTINDTDFLYDKYATKAEKDKLEDLYKSWVAGENVSGQNYFNSIIKDIKDNRMPKVEDIIAKIKEKLSPDVPVEVYNSGKGMHSARVARYK